jgi:TetR/AcrR family transcriptional regulator, transcriptional repressor for nem operon
MKAVKQPRALATRERILRAAARLFALKGYHDTKLEEILAAARVTTGAFFHHCRSKEELGFAVLDRHMEKRGQQLRQLERDMPAPNFDDPLQPVFRRLDAIREMVRQRQHRKGGCVIGNLSTELSATHDGFRQRLADCFDEMAQEYQPHLEAAVRRYHPGRFVDTRALARYIVALIEGSIMLSRTLKDNQLLAQHFDQLKKHLQRTCGPEPRRNPSRKEKGS